MINILTSKDYEKSFKKKDKFVQKKALERIELFMQDPFNVLLNNYRLTGEHKDERSFNITGDYRIIFYYVSKDTVVLSDIGTHPELYE
ncbi:MAG: type II toxin-antitoxin system mRNA interferase toxin, RelE/StbE family [Candidatus Paceibacterota bacterium]